MKENTTPFVIGKRFSPAQQQVEEQNQEEEEELE